MYIQAPPWYIELGLKLQNVANNMWKYTITVNGLKLHKLIALCTNLGIQEAKIRSPNSREERNFGVLQKRCHDLPHTYF